MCGRTVSAICSLCSPLQSRATKHATVSRLGGSSLSCGWKKSLHSTESACVMSADKIRSVQTKRSYLSLSCKRSRWCLHVSTCVEEVGAKERDETVWTAQRRHLATGDHGGSLTLAQAVVHIEGQWSVTGPQQRHRVMLTCNNQDRCVYVFMHACMHENKDEAAAAGPHMGAAA